MRITVPQVVPATFYYDRLVEVIYLVAHATTEPGGVFAMQVTLNTDPNFIYVVKYISVFTPVLSHLLWWGGEITYGEAPDLHHIFLPTQQFTESPTFPIRGSGQPVDAYVYGNVYVGTEGVYSTEGIVIAEHVIIHKLRR